MKRTQKVLTLNSANNYRKRRRGLTLTELLVVVSIVVVLAGTLVPMVQPVMRGQKVREAARQVNVFMTSAQARAIELGRPVGVWIERAAHDPGEAPNLWYAGYKLYLAEQPEPYTGDIYDAKVVIQPSGSPTAWNALYQGPGVPLSCCQTLFPSIQRGFPLASPGDLIQFEGRGPMFVISGIDNFKMQFLVDTPEKLQFVQRYVRAAPASVQQLPVYQPGVRFEVFRRPVKTAGTPIELPRNTAVDLSLSGYGAPYQSPYYAAYQSAYPGVVPNPDAYAARFRQINPEFDVVIMFSPQGGVDRVHYVSHEPNIPTFWELPQGSIYLMLARDDQIGRDEQGNFNVLTDHPQNTVGSLGTANLRDQDNIWLTIATQNGRVLSNPNGDGFANPMTGSAVAPSPFVGDARQFIQNARRFTTTGQSMGGR